ncbi:DUF177 domain-containing protein [uncultured Cohaesibacter sp.]|uniref:YceD family protein n=1 Tax=uncultured Cohaesibacter sp. TaxID=1002546 RepID=UPI0029C679AF|nr:DUF177 domain-containing protein [uncultured Cohaesibacter sp.]
MARKETMEDNPIIDPVLSLPVTIARLKSLGETVKASADAATCEKLRERLGVLAVHSYSVDAKVFPWKKTGARIEGRVMGEVEQACVVTLQPVPETIDEPLVLTLLPEGSPFALRANNTETGGEMVVDPEGEDPPETFSGDEVDIGVYAEEFFAMALDDYPRLPGVEFDGHMEDDPAKSDENKPFAALAGLKDKLSKDDQN